MQRRAGILAVLVLGSAAVLAQSRGERADPRLVHLDAIAVDGQGRRVQDLSATDVEVVENGEVRAVESVRFVRATGQVPSSEAAAAIASSDIERQEAGREGTRLFAIFLDEYHVSPGEPTERAKATLNDFLDRNLGPRDMVVVARPLDSLPNLRLTRDRASMRDAIAAFNGRKGDFAPRTDFERNYLPPDPARLEAARAQIVLSALSAMAAHVGPLNVGRKTIVLVSEGFALPPRRRTELPLPAMDGVVRVANRANVSIYPLDPRALMSAAGTAASSPDGSERSAQLERLASQTNGRAILVANDLAAGFDQLISDASGYYVITFAPGNHEEPGRFHSVDVRVRRAGISLRSRTGYWDPAPDVSEALRRVVDEPATNALIRRTSTLIRPWFGMARAEDGKTRVQFIWEPAPTVPGVGVRARTVPPARASVSVLDQTGGVIAQREVRALGADGGERQALFDLEPGRVTLYIQIQDADANVLDTDIRDLTVAAFDGPFSIGTAQVFRARNARELRELTASGGGAPLITRQFSRSESLVIRIPVYASRGEVELTATLVSAIGGQRRALDAVVTPEPAWRVLTVPLAGLAPGEYRIDYAGRVGGSTAQDSIAFRVTP